MLAKMSSVNVFTHQRSLNTRCVGSMAQLHSVTPLPIENPFPMSMRNGTEVAYNAERKYVNAILIVLCMSNGLICAYITGIRIVTSCSM